MLVTAGALALAAGGDRHGDVVRIARARSIVPAGVVLQYSGVWYRFSRGHLVLGRGRRTRWRSRGPIAPDQIGVIVASPTMIAFQHDHKLYISRLGGFERPVASREMPLGWSGQDLYAYRYAGRDLVLRSDTGRLLRVIARQPFGSEYVYAAGGLYFLAGGRLMGARGTTVRPLGQLRRLGVSARPMLQSAGGLAELQDDDRMVLVRPDGSVFASTRLPRNGGHAETISASPVLSPDGRAVAFATAAGPPANPADPRPVPAIDAVYLLAQGARTATRIHERRLAIAPCDGGAELQWRGDRVLYENSDGHRAAIGISGNSRSG